MSSNKQAIKEFRQITSTSDKVAKEVLKKFNYNLEQAMDYFFQNRSRYPAAKTGDESKVNKIFNKYSGEGEEKDLMCDEKLEAYLEEVGADPMTHIPLVLAYKLGAKEMGEFPRKEFCAGWAKLGADTVGKMKAQIKAMGKEMTGNTDRFKSFYRWVFELSKEEEGRKTIDKDVAIQMWGLLLPGHFENLAVWCTYITNHKSKVISKDLWEQLYEFAKDVRADLSNYDEDAAWPSAIDEFVEDLQEGKIGKE